ncbi:Endo-beta-1,4-glucanase D [Colletotrichum sojae]|uniref:lytic cellulose monooxygenase (C4-dehydrogenating) n=1 Tax=Colletotrichum sojae TaxID=2175907 RepID=A0A8H6JAY2_9PEZI|nr:Endo-beta-1,4-glucanase D [Colletotrichum sojae]
MRFSYTAATLAMMTGSAYGHARVWDLYVNGKAVSAANEGGMDKYIRSPPNNNPVKDLTSADIVCNTAGSKAAPEFAPVAAGDKVAFEWYHNTKQDDIIDGSHKGPALTYIAPYSEDPTGAVWSKIGSQVYEGGKWAVDEIKNGGVSKDVTIPSTLKAGKYMLRHEIIAHHESDTTYDVNPARGAQFYPSCIQIEVTGSGSDVPNQNFDFQKDYKYSDKGIHFNLYSDDATTYKAPGPEIWSAGSGSGSSPAPPTTTAAPAVTSSAAAVPTTLATQVSSAAPVASSAPAAAPSATAAPSNPPSSGCKRRRSRKARRSAH